jgi:hypothetical protein
MAAERRFASADWGALQMTDSRLELLIVVLAASTLFFLAWHFVGHLLS